MNEIKRKSLYVTGVIAVLVSAVVGAYVAFVAVTVVLFDGVAGSQKISTEPGFLMGLILATVIAILSFALGSYLRDNYRKME